MKRPSTLVVLLLCVLVVFSGQSLYAQLADRAEITGIVTDTSGAAVPDAKVSITNQDTGAKIVVGTNSAGNYSTPPLQLGSYTIEVEKEGFKHATHPGIVLSGAQSFRQDVKLELGSVTQSVEVEGGSELINTENSTVSHTIGSTYYRDLPGVMGADIRLAESLLQLQPGFVPMQPNGDAIFRGSQFTSRINGGQTMATENWFDGAAFGYAEGHQGTQESSVPYTSVQEMTVVENTFSAQYGHTSGGFITYTTKSGTDQLHGNVYNFFTNDKLDAGNFFFTNKIPNKKLPLTQDNWGAAIGGPVPKITKWGKTFWFVNVDGLDYHSTVNTGFVNTLPTPLQRQGDFSEFLTGAQAVDANNKPIFDALGRPIFQGEIFNPSTTRIVNGVPVRDGYGFDPTTGLPIQGQANVIPANDPLRSAIAAQLAALIPPPDRPGLTFNSFSPSGNKYINPKTLFVRVDQALGNNFNMSTSVNANTRPSLRQCASFSQGCNFTNPANYFGEGFYQDITTRTVHQQFNWIIRPNLFNHTTLSFDRWVLPANPVSAGQHWVSRLGLKGPLVDTGGAPRVYFSNFDGGTGNSPNIPYSHYGESDTVAEGCIANRWQFLDDITWVKGKHTLKAGFEYRHHQFPTLGNGNTSGRYNFSYSETAGWDSKGNQLTSTGDPVASFLLGQVDNANFNVNFRHLENEQYISPWFNDEFKATKNLTLTIGLRFDYQGCLSEAHGNQSTFGPTTPNPGAGGHLGAVIFAGKGTGRTGKTCFEEPKKDAWGPRVGFAYRINNGTSIRGGYGIYYGGIPANQFSGSAELGFSTNPTVPNFTNGFAPAFYWDSGFPQSSIKLPPSIDPTIGNGQGPTWITKDSKDLPRYQNYSLSVEHEFGSTVLLSASYIGNHGTRLPSNAATLGLLDNMNNPSVLALGAALLGADINSPAAVAAGILPPYAGFQGDVAQALRPWPQFTNLNIRSVQ